MWRGRWDGRSGARDHCIKPTWQIHKEDMHMAMLITAVEAWLRARADKEDGQGLAEYGLILALIAVVAIVALTGLGQGIASTMGNVTAGL
jgi:pilus assembly protein Flp/PilA